jgi:hypothetical protein
MAEKIKGSIERTGVRVAETYTIDVEFDDGEKERSGDIDGYLAKVRRFLEQEGYQVNNIRIDGEGDAVSAIAARRPTWVHELWPYKSDWHCCY